jgi:hypothetical protein
LATALRHRRTVSDALLDHPLAPSSDELAVPSVPSSLVLPLAPMLAQSSAWMLALLATASDLSLLETPLATAKAARGVVQALELQVVLMLPQPQMALGLKLQAALALPKVLALATLLAMAQVPEQVDRWMPRAVALVLLASREGHRPQRLVLASQPVFPMSVPPSQGLSAPSSAGSRPPTPAASLGFRHAAFQHLNAPL